MATGIVESVLPAIVDGRALTPRYIQAQLFALHEALISIAGQAVRQEYEGLTLPDFLDQEYSVAHGKDNLGRRSAYGCAFIVPSQHTRVASLLQAVAAAIAAGNCLIVYLPQTLSQIDTELRRLLSDSLDKTTCILTDQRRLSGPNLASYASRFASVFLDGSDIAMSDLALETFVAPTCDRAIAVVDRTADVASAARNIVRARFRFGGTSPYAAHVVLVNEFVSKEFCMAAADVFTKESAEAVADGQFSTADSNADFSQRHLAQIEALTIVSGAMGKIAFSKNREKSLTPTEDVHSTLVIVPVSSLDDAIDFACSHDTVFLAAHLFASATAAKYLSQFVPCRASFVNHIPVQLLVGPAALPQNPVSLLARTPKEVFSRPAPEHVTETQNDRQYAETINSRSNDRIATLRATLAAPLTEMNLPMTTTIGFFEQGLFLGSSIVGSLVVSSSVGLVGFLMYKTWQLYR